MSGKYVLPAAIVVGAVIYAFKDRLFGTGMANVAAKEVQAAPAGGSPTVVNTFLPVTKSAEAPVAAKLSLNWSQIQAKQLAVKAAPPAASAQAGGAIGTIGVKDVAQVAGATAAAAACTSLGGVGAIAAPLCAQGGSAVAGLAVDGGKAAGRAIGNAASEVGGFVKGLFS